MLGEYEELEGLGTHLQRQAGLLGAPEQVICLLTEHVPLILGCDYNVQMM